MIPQTLQTGTAGTHW